MRSGSNIKSKLLFWTSNKCYLSCISLLVRHIAVCCAADITGTRARHVTTCCGGGVSRSRPSSDGPEEEEDDNEGFLWVPALK